MQGEFRGKPIFTHRYVGMDEDSIREEIERLQGEIYSMQTALDLYSKDNSEIRKVINDGQANNEKLLKGVEIKLQDLRDSLDYGTPVKKQLEDASKEFTTRLEEVYNKDRLAKSERNISALIALSIVNTIIIVLLLILVGYSILFI